MCYNLFSVCVDGKIWAGGVYGQGVRARVVVGEGVAWNKGIPKVRFRLRDSASESKIPLLRTEKS